MDRITGFLAHAKLGRFGERGRVFSFVHRRFNEFFLVQWLLQDDSRAYERARTIPEDGRWRDALVLYIEIAKSDASSVIADLCFSESTKLLAFESSPGDAAYARGLHCIRFMVDAFRNRPHYILNYLDQLTKFISTALSEKNDILVRKNAVEAMGLLPTEEADRLSTLALSQKDRWVRETAFRACRYLPSLTTEALTQVVKYFMNIPPKVLLGNYRHIRFCSPFRKLSVLLVRWTPSVGQELG